MNEAELGELRQTDGKSLNGVYNLFLQVEALWVELQVVAHVV